MSVWLTEAQYAFAFFGLLSVLLLAPWISLQYRRFGTVRGFPAVVSAAIVLYGCAIVAFTMFPLPRTTPGYCARHADRSYWQLTPFASLDDVTAYAQDHTLLQTLASGVVLQVVMNVVLFVPLGFLMAYRYRRPWWRAAVTALGLSLAIELTQGTGLWGLAECPYRLADVDDLLTNTIGGSLGWVLGRWLGPHLPDPIPHRQPDLAAPTLRRRALSVGLDLWVYLLIMLGILLAAEVHEDAPDIGTVAFAGLSAGVSLVLFAIGPALTARRAGPGAASVHLVLLRLDGRAAPRRALVVRWATRWLPLAVLGLLGFAAVVIVDGLVAWRRADHRSLSDVLSGTVWATREQAALSPPRT